MMTAGGRMNIIPEKIFVRIDPGCALGRINCVDEVVMCGLAQDPNRAQPGIEGVNMNGNPAPGESANGRSNDGIETIAIDGGSVVKCQDPGWIAERIRNRAEGWNIRDEKIPGAGVGQPHDQTSDTISCVDCALRAVIIKEIVAAAPKNV